MGLLQATKVIWKQQGPIGLFQGHSATLLRIFPYAAIKFMAYERLEGVSYERPEPLSSLADFTLDA